MRFAPRSRPKSVVGRIPLTSMIDVIFLLLIFFMATTTLSTPESRLSPGLLEERAGGAASDLTPQVVRVERDGTREVFRLGERVFGDRRTLVAALAELPKEPGVFVRAADDASVAGVAAALQACRDAGFTRVSYVPE